MKKEQRKQLELELLKQIEQTLNKHNPVATKKVAKTIQEISKKIAKKFQKAIPSTIVQSKNLKKTTSIKKIAAKKGTAIKSTIKNTTVRKKQK
ncbi:MAG: hypothetical protein JNL69_06560 [Bacteroidia bacterium]|nr:hypothetical protein [Bacteroidia bacterium]